MKLKCCAVVFHNGMKKTGARGQNRWFQKLFSHK